MSEPSSISSIPTPTPSTDSLASLRAGYEQLYSGVVYDALCFDLHHAQQFVVHRSIAPVWPTREVLFGPAFTCKGLRVQQEAEIDDRVRIQMFRSFVPGCVQVIDTDGDDSVAHFGDISGKLAHKFGARGVVIDGFTRDVRILEADRFPVFCRGAQPVDAYGRWQIVRYQEEIRLAGLEGWVAVAPGDYVFADSDGVLMIPQRLAEEVCALASARKEREDVVRARLRRESDIQALYDEIGRW